MIDAVPEKKVVKINATIDDDINLILDAITKVEAAFIMLVLPEGNDLANSPIGLKALRKKTYEKGKRMVLVVPKGSGYELAKKAGFIASVSQEAVTGDVWQTVVQQFDEYKQTQAGMNSQKGLPKHLEKKVEYMAPIPEHLPIPEIITAGGKVVSEEVQESSQTEPRVEEVQKTPEKFIEPPPVQTPPSQLERLANQDITGMDFSKLVKKSSGNSFFGPKKTAAPLSANTSVAPQEINTFHPDIVPKKVGSSLTKVKKPMGAFAKFLLFSFIGAIIATVGVFAAYYVYFPKVRVDLKVQSTAMSVTDQVLATSAVTGFDINRKEIQMTKEKIEKNGAQSFTATESGSDGTKATGTITVINSDPAPKNVPVGTLVTSGGKKFVVSGAAVVVDVSAPVSVTATEIGEDYNLPASSIFAVSGFPTLSGQNAAAFTGGTKRTFTVVGQKDVDKATKELQSELAKQAEADLSYMNQDKGFEFIKDSLKTEVKGKPVISPAVGAEVKEGEEDPSVSMFINTTALYYHSESLTKLAERLLLDKYKAEKNLSADDAARTTIDSLSIKVDKVTVEKDDKVTIAFSASGLATSRLDIEKIRNDVAGKKWPEMLSYLSALPALAQQPEVKFYPTWLPEWARYVPNEVARIDVGVKVVAPEAPAAQ
ncbi:MAG: baseplate J/gp47 family protein [Patescibacteria group bacterium]